MTVAEPDAEVAAIMEDASVSLVERMRRKQDLMNKRFLAAAAEDEEEDDKKESEEDLEYLKCGICLELCERPVSTSCQHNFCLKCFKKYINHGKKDCPTCRAKLSRDLIQNPRVNTMLTSRLRKVHAPSVTVQVTHHKDSDRPDDAFTTEHAKRKGLSNACSGRMRVTCAHHHFGPIGPEYDPERGVGLCVGDTWSSRLHCRQWGAHMPHVAGIAGQSGAGAQSIILSGGYEDDKDEGEWLLYTGAGGRDLSGNKRTNKVQSSDQEFEGANKALLKSCKDGLPVRVLRSYKEKRSCYAPVKTDPSQSIRYDGIYRIIAAWRTAGQQGKLMCRYLLRRCDNSPAPWDSGTVGDGPWDEELPEEATEELNNGQDVHKPKGQPFWDYDTKDGSWKWIRPAPVAVKKEAGRVVKKPTAKKEETAILRSLAKCHCSMCKLLLKEPVCTPCGHQFCKSCLVAKFAAEAPTDCAARPLRVRRQRKPCPMCSKDLADFMEGATFQVNRAMEAQIDKLQKQLSEVQEKVKAEEEAKEGNVDIGEEETPDGEEDADEEEPEEEPVKAAVKVADVPLSKRKPSPEKKRRSLGSPGKLKPVHGTGEGQDEESGDEDALPCRKRPKVDATQRAAG